ncbi:MAG: hypothetical protein ACFBSD_05735 [Paracoccaceae bacterium]
MRILGLPILMVLAVGSGAPAGADGAGAPPEWLSGRYASDPAACPADGLAEDALVLDAPLLTGYEFGCVLLGFWPVRWSPTDPGEATVALASCGDDSGITRPDLLSIIREPDGTLTLQSQNEYARASAWPEPVPGYVSRRYAPCPR